MLIFPFLYYTLEYFFMIVLGYDTLGFIVSFRKHRGDYNILTVLDFKRLVFSWIYVLSIIYVTSWMKFIPLIDEIVLLSIMLFTIPVFNVTEKVTDFLFIDEGPNQLFYNFCNIFLSRILPPKKHQTKRISDAD